MSKSNVTFLPNEVLFTLQRPAKNEEGQPIAYVEGPTDVQIYRHIAHLSDLVIPVQDCGSRNTLFTLFDLCQTSTVSIKRKVIFFADKDLYVFEGIPADKRGIHFTSGYSIENDLFEDGKEDITALLNTAEKTCFQSICEDIAKWFAYEVHLVQSGHASVAKYQASLRAKIDTTRCRLMETFLEGKDIHITPNELKEDVIRNFATKLCGKFLFDALFEIGQSRDADKQMKSALQQDKALWQLCIAKGLQKEHSNSKRIMAIMTG